MAEVPLSHYDDDFVEVSVLEEVFEVWSQHVV